ncbi:transposase [Candidatus Enterovibrio altilux]|uniref:transposase n=1 Tax=Candidatus Enterovibrio altilux TaxID=1927128 RepID=UPI0016813908|nr:transposase [Candidatus Enterovibrio luxaltus]
MKFVICTCIKKIKPIKHVFSILLRGLKGFTYSVSKFVQLSLSCPHYARISKRTRMVNVMFKMKNKGSIQHLAIDFAGLKVYNKRA